MAGFNGINFIKLNKTGERSGEIIVQMSLRSKEIRSIESLLSSMKKFVGDEVSSTE